MARTRFVPGDFNPFEVDMRATWSAGLVLPFALIAAGCGSGGNVASSQTQAASSASSRAGEERGNKSIGVLTRNLYLGADLAPVIGATPATFADATTAVASMVQRNDFHERARGIAAEVAETRPALIGLQEAVTWKGDVDIDYVTQLLDALKARGLDYRLVAEVTLLDVPPVPTKRGFIRLTDHGAILARADVRVTKSEGHVFQTLFRIPTAVLGTVIVPRGWVSVDVEHGGEQFRFVSTHLESFDTVIGGAIRTAQAGELKAALANETRPVILVGDLNSRPGTLGEAVLASAGFEDVWGALHADRPGLTCCFPEDLTQIGALSERIDYVLVRGGLEPRNARVLGANRGSRVGGLWPSDHAGLFASVRLGGEEDDD